MATGATDRGDLTEHDAANVRAFLARVLDNYKADRLAKDAAVGSLAHVMGAMAAGDLEEARRWIEEGSSLGHGT
jgi:hypothetical protein